MERKYLQQNWSELREQIGEWWDDLTDEDLDRINGKQDQLVAVLQDRYGYTRSLAFMEVKIRMATYRPEGEELDRHSRALKGFQYASYNNDDWTETQKPWEVRRSRAKIHV